MSRLQPATGEREAPGTPLPSGNDPALLDEALALGWNWAAFLMPYPWLLGHGRLTWGMILLLTMGVPVVGFAHLAAYPIVAFYLGRHGYRLAWTYAPYHALDDLVAGEREWVVWGVVFKLLLLLTTILTGIYFLWIMRQPELLQFYRDLLLRS